MTELKMLLVRVRYNSNHKPVSMAWHVAHQMGTERLWVWCSAVVSLVPDAWPYILMLILGLNKCVAWPKLCHKDIKSCTYCFYVRCATLILWVGEMPWHQTVTTHYHAQLGLLGKGFTIKGLVVSCVVWLGSMIHWMGLWKLGGLIPCCSQDGYQAQIPQHQ